MWRRVTVTVSGLVSPPLQLQLCQLTFGCTPQSKCNKMGLRQREQHYGELQTDATLPHADDTRPRTTEMCCSPLCQAVTTDSQSPGLTMVKRPINLGYSC